MDSRKHSISIIYLTSLLQGAIFVSFPAASRILTLELGISETLYGSLYLPMVGVGAATSLLGTAALRSLGLLPLFLAGLVANAISLLALASLPRMPVDATYPVLVSIALLFGVSLGFMGIALNTGAMRLFPSARARALAVLHASLGLGAAGGPLLVSFFDGRGFWEGAPILLSMGSLSVIAISRVRPVEGFERSEPGASHPWKNVPGRIWSRGVTTFLYGIAESTLGAWAILFLTQHRNTTDSDAARALAAFWLCMTAGRLGGTLLLRKTGAFSLVVTLLFAMAIMFPLVTLTGSGLSAILVYGLAGVACSAVFPILMGLASEEAPEHLPQVSSILSACLLVGLGLGSFWVGPLSAEVSMAWVLRLSAIWPILLLGAVVALRVRPSVVEAR